MEAYIATNEMLLKKKSPNVNLTELVDLTVYRNMGHKLIMLSNSKKTQTMGDYIGQMTHFLQLKNCKERKR